jgi:hypothetical protein
MVQECKSLHLADGYVLNTADGYSWTSAWVKVLDYDKFSVSAVFVGGNPSGTILLQQSNDLEADTGAAMGGGGLSPIFTIPSAAASSIPRWADPYRGSSFANDTAGVPSGNGVHTTAVNGPGAYVLNQWLFGYSFVRVLYNASSNSTTTLSLYMNVKG